MGLVRLWRVLKPFLENICNRQLTLPKLFRIGGYNFVEFGLHGYIHFPGDVGAKDIFHLFNRPGIGVLTPFFLKFPAGSTIDQGGRKKEFIAEHVKGVRCG